MSDKTVNLSLSLPLVCTRGIVVFPGQEMIIDVGRTKSMNSVQEAQKKSDSQIILVSQRVMQVEDPQAADLYTCGTLCHIRHVRRMDGYVRVKFKGLQRVRITAINSTDSLMTCSAEVMLDEQQDTKEEMALVRSIANHLQDMEGLTANMP